MEVSHTFFLAEPMKAWVLATMQMDVNGWLVNMGDCFMMVEFRFL